MAFRLGSLGFLTPFKFESFKTEVDKVFEGRVIESFLYFPSLKLDKLVLVACCLSEVFVSGSCR